MKPYVRRLKRAKQTVRPEFEAINFKHALDRLREARAILRALGAPRSADYVARAIKSTEGARNHASLRKYALNNWEGTPCA